MSDEKQHYLEQLRELYEDTTPDAPEHGRGKADFRAMRETVGLSQETLARRAKVQVTTVKRWERMSYPDLMPPEGVWEMLEELKRNQDYLVDMSLEKLEELTVDLEADAASRGVEARINYPLTYYKDQRQWIEYGHPDADPRGGDYAMSNATTRIIADELRADGKNVRFVYPDETEED